MNYWLVLVCALGATALSLLGGSMPYAPAAIALFAIMKLATGGDRGET